MQSEAARLAGVAYISIGGRNRGRRLLEECATVFAIDDPAQFERPAVGPYGVFVIELAQLDVAARATVRLVRERASLPVLAIATLEPPQRALLLADGADDIVPADVDGAELRHRLAALGRREPRETRNGELRYRDVALAVDRRIIRRGARRAYLTRKEEALLRAMLRQPDRVVSSSELIRAIDLARDSHATLQTYICTMRRKLNHPGEEAYVTTVRGNGYVFDADAT